MGLRGPQTRENSDKRSARLTIRLRPSTIASLTRIADRDDQSKADVVEALILRAAQRRPDADCEAPKASR